MTLDSLIMVNHILNAWLMRLQGSGHGFMYQEPSHFSQIIIDFLDWNLPLYSP